MLVLAEMTTDMDPTKRTVPSSPLCKGAGSNVVHSVQEFDSPPQSVVVVDSGSVEKLT